MKKAAPLMLLSLFCLLASLGLAATAHARYQVGAYYYVWFPENWHFSYLRERTRPAQPPLLGEYSSRDPAVAERHIAWATKHGLDFMAVDWWPSRTDQNQAIQEGFLKAGNLGDIKFCVFHETWEIAYRPHDGRFQFGGDVTEKFRSDLRKVAQTFFHHPNYLRINGRPVVILYLTRIWIGEFAEAVRLLRQDMAELGHDIYIIADEVYWQVVSTSTNRLVDEPQPHRMFLFDAVTAYNMHDELLKDDHYGYAGGNGLLQDIEEKYREYVTACANEVAFVPGVLPGFNDRGSRLGYDHYCIPRLLYHGAPEGSLMEGLIDKTVLPFMDPKANMALVTSWNEWNEDTNIEPTVTTGVTDQDESGGKAYTQGFQYAGYGYRYLEVLRDKMMAVYGRVTGNEGGPAPGIRICAWDKDVTLECKETDSDGWYTISRENLPPGRFEVGPALQAGRNPVTVLPERAERIDLVWRGGP